MKHNVKISYYYFLKQHFKYNVNISYYLTLKNSRKFSNTLKLIANRSIRIFIKHDYNFLKQHYET